MQQVQIGDPAAAAGVPGQPAGTGPAMEAVRSAARAVPVRMELPKRIRMDSVVASSFETTSSSTRAAWGSASVATA